VANSGGMGRFNANPASPTRIYEDLMKFFVDTDTIGGIITLQWCSGPLLLRSTFKPEKQWLYTDNLLATRPRCMIRKLPS
jgi:hypothetical protein